MRRIATLLLCLSFLVPMRAQAAVTSERGFVTSFDGTRIVYNLFIPDRDDRVPAVFSGHGWSGTGQTQVAGFVKRLTDAGYAVVTWDARGFGDSGGETHVNDPAYEARDMSALIDMLASRPEILLEAPGDPVVGMSSGSYAGGIQLVTAAHDSRVDAIAPRATWNDLSYSLFPNDVVKATLGAVLFANGLKSSAADGADPESTAGPQAGSYSPDLLHAMTAPTILGSPDASSREWWTARSLAGYGAAHPIRVPTLLIQGIADPLFKVNEAMRTFEHVASQGAPVNLVLVCSAHGPCPYASDGDAHANDRTMAWFDRYLKGIATPPTPAVGYIDNEGTWRSANRFDLAADEMVTATGAGRVIATGGDSGTDPNNANPTRAAPSRAGDPGTLTVATGVGGGTLIVGVPRVRVRATVLGNGAHLFFKLVDREANEVLDLQEMPLRIDGPRPEPASYEIDLTAVAYRLPAGHHLDLQIATSSVQFLEYRGSAVVDLDVDVTVPVSNVSDPEPTPTPTPTPSSSATAEPSPGPPGTPQLLPATTVVAAGRVPHEGNTQVAFWAYATRMPDGSVTGMFFMRDPATTGARANGVGTVDAMTISGDRAVLEGPCDIAGDPDARCRIVLRDIATPGRGKDWASFAAPGFAESGVLVDGEIAIQG